MPYGLMADCHFHPWSAFATTTHDGQNSRLVGLLDELERCCSEVHLAGGQHVVIAGDVFHVRGSVKPSVFNAVRDRLNYCHATYTTEFFILAGNHDLEGRDATRLGSAVTGLEGDFIHVINETTWVEEIGAFMVPWIDKIADLKQELIDLAEQATAKEETDLIIHAPIDGVILGLPDHGLDPTWLHHLDFRRVFAGHYHNHREMVPGVASIGALAHHSWSDIGTRAGFLLVNDHGYTWRKSHLPEFIDVGALADIADPDEIPLLVDKNYVRIKVPVTTSTAVEAARDELLAMGAAAVLVQPEAKATPVRPLGATATVATGATLEGSVANFIKAMTLPELDLDEVSREAADVLAAAGTED